jgi:sugar/nucleoside kinase (ribokinase family)
MSRDRNDVIESGYRAALALLRSSLTSSGFVASPEPRANYRRVWARDGIICGLAGLVSGEPDLTDGLRSTLDTLAAAQGPSGQIPSNVAVAAEETGPPSYGGLAGRVDAGLWFTLGAARYCDATGDHEFAGRLRPVVDRVLALVQAWEFNDRGFVYVPQSGDWADEYDLHGYLLYDQVLYLAALRAWAPFAGARQGAYQRRAQRLHDLIERNFWLDAAVGQQPGTDLYHPLAYQRAANTRVPVEHYVAGFTPAGYTVRFDGFGAAVGIATGALTAPEPVRRTLEFGQALAQSTATGLVPAFWPQISERDAEWKALRSNFRDQFSNHPGCYHNGGVWPVVNGWWGLALVRHGRVGEARGLLARIHAFNRESTTDQPWGFGEYAAAAEARPRGTARCAWSAAGAVLLHQALAHPDKAPVAARPPSVRRVFADGPELIAVGEVLVDFVSQQPVESLADAGSFDRLPGGSPANLASTLSHLRRRVALVGAVGADALGRFLCERLAQRGLPVDGIARRADAPTSHVLVARSVATPDFAVFRGADCLIGPDQLPDALLAGARIFHTTCFALSREPARSAILAAAARAHHHGAQVSIDLNYAAEVGPEPEVARQNVARLCALGALVKVSRDDMHRLWGAAQTLEDTISVLHQWGARCVCFTDGAGGSWVSPADGAGGPQRTHIPAQPVDVVDVTGAGDAYWAGFLDAWLAGVDPVACGEAGVRVCTAKLTRVGVLSSAAAPTM